MTPSDLAASDLLRVGDLTVDLSRQVARMGADEIRLRPKTFDVLTVLMRHAGQVVSKQRLIELVWGDVAVTDDSLVQCLVEIRRALGDVPDPIRTVRGRGYLLDGAVEILARGAAPGTPKAAVAAAGQTEDAAATSGPAPGETATPAGAHAPVIAPRTRLKTYAAIAGLAALVLAGGATALRRTTPVASPPALQDTMVPEARRALESGLAFTRASRAQTTMREARAQFERAIVLDDGYAAAHAALANVLVLLSAFGVEPALQVLPTALAEARRAVALDPTLASGWQALAHAQTQGEWDWAGAEGSYRRAIALDPAAQSNMIFAHLLVGLGRADDAVAESDRLLAFDAASPMRHGSNCVVKYLAHRYAAALAACDRGLALNPDESLSHFWRALTLTALGRHDEAMQAALASRRGMGFTPTWLVGYVHARAGRLDDAREVLRAVQARAATTYVPPVEIAFLEAAVGNQAAALDGLERGYRAQGPWMELLAVHPAADALRAEPRFQALLAALRLPALPS